MCNSRPPSASAPALSLSLLPAAATSLVRPAPPSSSSPQRHLRLQRSSSSCSSSSSSVPEPPPTPPASIVGHPPQHERDRETMCGETDEDGGCGGSFPAKGKGGVVKSFPIKLHDMLDAVDSGDEDDSGRSLAGVVSWQVHGRCFVVRNHKRFASEVMPRYFKQTKFASFQRQLNLYGFRRFTQGRDKNGYYHELFLRGQRHLVGSMTRMKVKGTRVRKATRPDEQPNFYSMPPMPTLEAVRERVRRQREEQQRQQRLRQHHQPHPDAVASHAVVPAPSSASSPPAAAAAVANRTPPLRPLAAPVRLRAQPFALPPPPPTAAAPPAPPKIAIITPPTARPHIEPRQDRCARPPPPPPLAPSQPRRPQPKRLSPQPSSPQRQPRKPRPSSSPSESSTPSLTASASQVSLGSVDTSSSDEGFPFPADENTRATVVPPMTAPSAAARPPPQRRRDSNPFLPRDVSGMNPQTVDFLTGLYEIERDGVPPLPGADAAAVVDADAFRRVEPTTATPVTEEAPSCRDQARAPPPTPVEEDAASASSLSSGDGGGDSREEDKDVVVYFEGRPFYYIADLNAADVC